MAADDPLGRLYSQAVDLHGAGRLAEAEPLYLQLLRHKPDHFGLLYFLGLLRLQQGRFAEALPFTESALRQLPGNARALFQHGMVLEKLGQLDAALASMEKATQAGPGEPELWKGHGDILLQLGRTLDAIASYDRALALAPDHAGALANRGIALCILQRPADALADFERVIVLAPDSAAAFANRARALMELGQPAPALRDYDRALALQPDFPDAQLGGGAALHRLERFAEARERFDRAIAGKPEFAEAFYNRADSRAALGDLPGAMDDYDRAIALQPDYAAAQVNKGLLCLARQDFAAGWPLYENRNRLPGMPAPDFAAPLWTGRESIAGKTLLLHAEQGLGDTLQFCRYGQLAERGGIKVVLSVQDQLARLLQGLSPALTVVGRDCAGAYDFHLPLLSAPYAFGTGKDAIPAAPFYLKAEPGLVRQWRERLGMQGRKIGIAWQGQKRGTVDVGRSFALRHFSAIARLGDVRLISLQKNDGAEQMAGIDFAVESLGKDFDAGPDAFVDTAAVMENLDLIITSDTAIAHLAGALGRPVWLALQFHPDWRWFQGRSDSPWYPTMRLFRQPRPGDWPGVFAAMAAALAS